MSRQLVIYFAVFLLAACAGPVTRQTNVDSKAEQRERDKQREIALQTQVDHMQRLYHVVFRTFHRAVSLCPRKRPDIGLYPINLPAFNKRYHRAAKSLYRAGPNIQALMVARGSPAALAGVRRGDVLISINTSRVPTGKKSVARFRTLLRKQLKQEGIIRLVLQRHGADGKSRSVTTVITPVRICDYSFGVVAKDQVNAYANGKFVVLTTGMMRFANNDDELALVVAHELAHNTMDHISKMKRNSLLGTLLDIVAAGYGVNTQGLFGSLALLRFSKEFEAEADYVGMYMMALAGWDISRAPNFWRRMAASHPGSNRSGFTRTHPTSSKRFLALEKIVSEIRYKQRKGMSMKPEMKKLAPANDDGDDE
jgi:hypothetical protein